MNIAEKMERESRLMGNIADWMEKHGGDPMARTQLPDRGRGRDDLPDRETVTAYRGKGLTEAAA